MALIQANGFDREYWLGHCEGFQVRSGRRRLGFVDEVRDDGRTLAVRGGFLGRRIELVSADDVFAVVPRDLRVWLHSSPAAAIARTDAPLLTEALAPVARIRRRVAARVAA